MQLSLNCVHGSSMPTERMYSEANLADAVVIGICDHLRHMCHLVFAVCSCQHNLPMKVSMKV